MDEVQRRIDRTLFSFEFEGEYGTAFFNLGLDEFGLGLMEVLDAEEDYRISRVSIASIPEQIIAVLSLAESSLPSSARLGALKELALAFLELNIETEGYWGGHQDFRDSEYDSHFLTHDCTKNCPGGPQDFVWRFRQHLTEADRLELIRLLNERSIL